MLSVNSIESGKKYIDYTKNRKLIFQSYNNLRDEKFAHLLTIKTLILNLLLYIELFIYRFIIKFILKCQMSSILSLNSKILYTLQM